MGRGSVMSGALETALCDGSGCLLVVDELREI
jgi:hypothetical protein